MNYLFNCTCKKCTEQINDEDVTSEEDMDDEDMSEDERDDMMAFEPETCTPSTSGTTLMQ